MKGIVEKALKEAIKAFLDEIEPEMDLLRAEFEDLRNAMLGLAKELADIAELFQRHLAASKLIEEHLSTRLLALEKPQHLNVPGEASESQEMNQDDDDNSPLKKR